MNSEAAIRAFRSAIIAAATEKLGRSLTERKERFITERGGFIALELIADTVNGGSKESVERYLNSEQYSCNCIKAVSTAIPTP